MTHDGRTEPGPTPPGRRRWQDLCRSLRAGPELERRYDQLAEMHQAPDRHYHNFVHIAECLQEWDHGLRERAGNPAAIEAAIWLHDAVYDPRAADNEEQSARLVRACFSEAGVAETLIAAVERLVRVTRTHTPDPAREDEAMIADVDLAILGRSPNRFDEYERQVREEYAWVPEAIYRTKRAAILEGFLQRPRIFHTPEIASRRETAARVNLQRSLAQLRGDQ